MIQENKEFLLYPTTGTSMFPFIRFNEHILVKRVPIERIRLGEVIVFESKEGHKVCHRVIKIEDNDGLWFQAKGDRNKFYDMPIRQEKILGKVIAVKRKMNLIELSNKGWKSLLYKFDCLFTHSIFYIKKFLVRVIFFLRRQSFYRKICRFILYRNIDFKILDENGYKFFVSKNNRIIASVYLNYSENNPYSGWWLWSLEVKLLYRRLGIASELVKKIIEFVAEKQAPILYLNICKENLVALRFYENLGFTIIPHSERYYKNLKRTDVYMQMNLNGNKNSEL